MNSHNSPSTKILYKGTQIIWYILGILEALLALRFTLKFFGADPTASFSSFVYDISHVFVSPFLNVFQATEISSSIFEWATLLAMVIYYLIAWGIVKLLSIGRTVSTSEAASRLDEDNN